MSTMTESVARPAEGRLSDATSMGHVELRVRNRDAVLDFYTRGVGLTPLWERGGQIALGLGGREVVRLVHAPDLRPSPSNAAGLFHTAILFDAPSQLAASLVRMFRAYPERYVGSGDHLVSEAFYFADPEGNGVELYVDRPREQWTWTDGLVRMDTLALDPAAFVREHLGADAALVEQDVPEFSAAVGHVHLQVGDIATAEKFYVDTLGFAKTSVLGSSALFVSAGGYHHHMAMNTWNSAGAGPRSSGLGLGVVDIRVPGTDEVRTVAARLAAHGVVHRMEGELLRVEDPWRNELRILAAEGPAAV